MTDDRLRVFVAEVVRRSEQAEAWPTRQRPEPAPRPLGTSARILEILAAESGLTTDAIADRVGVSEDAARGALRVLRQRGQVVSDPGSDRQRHRVAGQTPRGCQTPWSG